MFVGSYVNSILYTVISMSTRSYVYSPLWGRAHVNSFLHQLTSVVPVSICGYVSSALRLLVPTHILFHINSLPFQLILVSTEPDVHLLWECSKLPMSFWTYVQSSVCLAFGMSTWSSVRPYIYSTLFTRPFAHSSLRPLCLRSAHSISKQPTVFFSTVRDVRTQLCSKYNMIILLRFLHP